MAFGGLNQHFPILCKIINVAKWLFASFIKGINQDSWCCYKCLKLINVLAFWLLFVIAGPDTISRQKRLLCIVCTCFVCPFLDKAYPRINLWRGLLPFVSPRGEGTCGTALSLFLHQRRGTRGGRTQCHHASATLPPLPSSLPHMNGRHLAGSMGLLGNTVELLRGLSVGVWKRPFK